jgi:hypothetical protein
MVAYTASGQTKRVHAHCRRTYRQLVWCLLTVVVCAGSLAILSCGGDDDPVTTTSATGTAILNINEDRTQIDFTLNVSTALPDIREAHIHISPPGVNGPIVLDFCTTNLVTPPAGVPLPPTCPPAPFHLDCGQSAAHHIGNPSGRSEQLC